MEVKKKIGGSKKGSPFRPDPNATDTLDVVARAQNIVQFQDVQQLPKLGEGGVLSLVPCDQILPDPANVREMPFNHHNIRHVDPKTLPAEDFQRWESLQELSRSIAEVGVVQPAVGWRDAHRIRLVFGHRRYLACILAEKPLPVRIFDTKPDQVTLRALQLAENFHREALANWEMVVQVQQLMEAYHGAHQQVPSAEVLAQWTGLGKMQVYRYMTIARYPDVLEKLRSGEVTSILAAVELCRIEDASERKAAIKEVASGASIQDVVSQAASRKTTGRGKPRSIFNIRIEPQKYRQGVRRLVNDLGRLSGAAISDDEIDWEDTASVEKAVKTILQRYLETASEGEK